MSDPLGDADRAMWADQPYSIELRGGRNDGRRFRWHDLPLMWRQPEPAPPGITQCDTDPSVLGGVPVADYRMTDRVTDDGHRIYEFDRYE